MAEKKTAKKSTKKSAASVGFTAEERAAMKEHAAELKAAARGADGEKQVLAAIAKMPEPDRTMGRRLHDLIKASGPNLSPKTWYGMPAYANKDGKVVVFFRGASKFKERYAMLGFNEWANLDEGTMWPTAFALTKLTPADEKKIGALVKQAVS